MHDSFPGAAVGYEPVSLLVDPPVLPAAVIDHALAASRKKSLLTNTDRDLLLVACAVEVERYVGRVFWPGEPAARTSTSVVIVRDSRLAVPYSPLYPDTSGVTLALGMVRLWDDDAQNWKTLGSLAPDSGYGLAPGARIIVNQRGQYEITASLTAPTAAPPSAIEAVARLWAYRDTLRPGDLADITGEQQVLAGALMKSGAAEILRGEKWRVTG